MIIYIASESGMPVGELREREDFIHSEGPGGRLFSYFHIASTKYTSGFCFNHLAGVDQDEPEKRRKRLDR